MKKSRLSCAMNSWRISFGQAREHSPWFVHVPKPSASICCDHREHAVVALGLALGQEREVRDLRRDEEHRRAVRARRGAGAAADALSRVHRALGAVLRDEDRVAVRRVARRRREMKPPAEMMRSKDERSTMRSLRTGNGVTRQGSSVMTSPSLKVRMWSWQLVVPRRGPCGLPFTTMPHIPQMPSRQSWSNAIGSSPFSTRRRFTTSSISRKDMSGLMPGASYVTNFALGLRVLLPPDVQGELHL